MTRDRKKVLAELRQSLLERREAIRRVLAGDLSALKELRDMSGDTADFAADTASTELNSQLAEVSSRELNQIDTALARMDAGEYGVCEVTGKDIPLARLEALPYATTSVEAQRQLESCSGEAGYVPDWSRMIDTSGPDDAISINDIELT